MEKITLSEILAKYGWSDTITNGEWMLVNAKGNQVCSIVQKGSKYKVLDLGGVKLMDGRGQLPKSIEKLLTQYYYATPVVK